MNTKISYSVLGIATGIMVFMIVALGAVNTVRNNQTAALFGSNFIVDATYMMDYDFAPAPEVWSEIPAMTLVLVAPSGTRTPVPLATAQKIDRVTRIKQTGIGIGEGLSSGNLPLNPLNKSQLLLTTVEPTCTDGLTCTSINRLYSYDIKTGATRLLFTAPSISDDGTGTELMIAGTDRSNVVFVVRPIGSGLLCQNAWAYKPKQYVYYNLSQPSITKLDTYTVPAFKVAKIPTDPACHNAASPMPVGNGPAFTKSGTSQYTLRITPNPANPSVYEDHIFSLAYDATRGTFSGTRTTTKDGKTYTEVLRGQRTLNTTKVAFTLTHTEVQRYTPPTQYIGGSGSGSGSGSVVPQGSGSGSYNPVSTSAYYVLNAVGNQSTIGAEGTGKDSKNQNVWWELIVP